MWETMDVERTQTYMQAMESLDAQEKLMATNISSWSRLKKDDRERIHRTLHRAAYPSTHENPIGPEELAKILGAGRIK